MGTNNNNKSGSVPADGKQPDAVGESDKQSDNSLHDYSSLIRTISLSGIFLLLLVYMLRYAAPVLVPFTLAIFLSLLLSPLVRRLWMIGVPRIIGAAGVILIFISLTATGIYSLSFPAKEWIDRAPVMMDKFTYKLRSLREPLEKAKKAAEQVSEIATGDGEENKNGTSDDNDDREIKVSVSQTNWVIGILAGTPVAIANIGIVIILMYFLLAGGDTFMSKLVGVIPEWDDKKRAVSIARAVQKDISHYLLTCTLINIVLGSVVAIALYFLDMPNPILWGAMVGLLNYAPYLGPAVSLAILTPIALLSLDSLSQAFLVPAIVLLLNILEGQLITPHIIGRRLALSPLVVFASIVIWGWLWGVAGALLAIPITVAMNVISLRIEFLNPLAVFLGESPRAALSYRRDGKSSDH